MIKLHFNIRYYTHYGDVMMVELFNNESKDSQRFDMEFINDEFCRATVEIDEKNATEIRYQYSLRKRDGTVIQELGDDKIISLSALSSKNIQVTDYWNDPAAIENTFFTAPFQKVFFKQTGARQASPAAKKFTHIFRVKSVPLKENEVLCLLGSDKSLHLWDAKKPVMLTPNGTWWEVALQLDGKAFPIAYKYAVWNTQDKIISRFEDGQNRTLYNNNVTGKVNILHDGFIRIPYQWKGAGVAIPVFSLRSAHSFGVGSFSDLIPFADWAKSVGMKLIQLLPVNDTSATNTWTDSYPYASISAFALHPIYINIPDILHYYKEQTTLNIAKTFEKRYKTQQKQLNELPVVDYEASLKGKWTFIEEIFKSAKQFFTKDTTYIAFFNENKHWLAPYAAFCALKENNHTADFKKWSSHSIYDEHEVNKLSLPGHVMSERIHLHYFVQFHLHLQLKFAADYAHQSGLALKGDIPIGIYRYSCDAWVAPDLYNMDQQAGAPPDDFAEAGQNWGFPTYNWNRMKEDGFLWWRQRFEQMSHYFDAFRIDHILGFFRIWSIPLHAVEGILGHFVPAIPITKAELYRNGLAFDYDRYCRPYITTQILNDVFGHHALEVRNYFLYQRQDGRYSLQEAFDTQRKVEAHFSSLPADEYHLQIRNGLYRLIENVILIEEAGSGGQAFHFRFGIEKTTSFQQFDGHTQSVLRGMYIDYFFRRQDDFWQKEAMEKLPTLKRSTKMLICGEDLGMVPDCVPDVMRELAILSLEIQRMPKQTGITFFHPNDAPYLSVVTPSTHDMSTIRGWWEEDRSLSQKFFRDVMGQWGNAPYFCEAWINRNIIEQHLYSPAMWSIFQLQDLMGSDVTLRRENPNDERINIPANPKHYWRYRMHCSIEELQKEDKFNHDLAWLIKDSGRS